MVKRAHISGTPAETPPKDIAAERPVSIASGKGAVTLVVRVTPRANRDALSVAGGQLRVWLRATPVDGAANTALIALFADRLSLPRRAISIIQGATARVKRIAFEGVTADELQRRISAAATG